LHSVVRKVGTGSTVIVTVPVMDVFVIDVAVRVTVSAVRVGSAVGAVYVTD
jgi:hypothetical protein